MKALLRPLWDVAARRAARAYVAGETVEDAVRTCRRWRSRGIAATLGYWNDSGESPESVRRHYADCVEVLERGRVDGYLSIKLAALDYRDDLLHPLLERAGAFGFRVHFDSLGPETVEKTNAAVERSLPVHADLGITLPSRWRRSLDDAEWAVKSGLFVRVVKGQWEDPEAPDRDGRKGFFEVVDRLAGRARRVAVATHDVELAEHCFARLEAAGTPADYELLHGLPSRKALELARRRGLTLRVYVPYGASWLPYSADWARRNPQVVWWLVRDLFGL